MKKDFKSGLEKDVGDVLKDFINKEIKEEKIHFFTGKVEDNLDPEKLGRCRVRVNRVFESEIPTKDLPWAKPDFGFIGSNLGSFIVPKVGTLVKVYFDNGEIYSPFYSTKAFNSKTANNSLIPQQDYPHIVLFYETDEGESYYINRLTLDSMWTHPSAVTIKFDAKGNIEIASNDASVGNLTIKMKGNIDICSEEGDISLTANKGSIKLGGDAATQAIPNAPASYFNGAITTIGDQLPGTPGAVYVKP